MSMNATLSVLKKKAKDQMTNGSIHGDSSSSKLFLSGKKRGNKSRISNFFVYIYMFIPIEVEWVKQKHHDYLITHTTVDYIIF